MSSDLHSPGQDTGRRVMLESYCSFHLWILHLILQPFASKLELALGQTEMALHIFTWRNVIELKWKVKVV